MIKEFEAYKLSALTVEPHPEGGFLVTVKVPDQADCCEMRTFCIQYRIRAVQMVKISRDIPIRLVNGDPNWDTVSVSMTLEGWLGNLDGQIFERMWWE